MKTRLRSWVLRKLFCRLGFNRQLCQAYECNIINSRQLHELAAIFCNYESAFMIRDARIKNEIPVSTHKEKP